MCQALGQCRRAKKSGSAGAEKKASKFTSLPSPHAVFAQAKAICKSKLFQACVQEIAAFPLTEIITEHDYAASWKRKWERALWQTPRTSVKGCTGLSLGVRHFSSAVSGFCQVFIGTRAKSRTREKPLVPRVYRTTLACSNSL